MTTCSSVFIPAFEQVNTSCILRASFTDKSKAFFHLLKSNVNSETITHLNGGFQLKSVKIFYRKLLQKSGKTRTPVRVSFSAKFINNTFDKVNNIYYCFPLSGAAIESHPGNQVNKKYFTTNQLHCIFKGFS